jgi:hypothetical protein
MMLRKNLYPSFFKLPVRVALGCLVYIALLYTVISCQEKDEFVPLKIHAIEPSEAIIGDTITIIGEGFSPGYEYNEISFQGVSDPIAPLSISNTGRLYVRVPDGAASGSIHINILDEETADSPPVTIHAPEITSITPDHAWIGDTVVIKGKNFRSEREHNAVKFNPATSNLTATVISASATELKAIVPSSARTGTMSVLGYAGVTFTLNPGEIAVIEPLQGVVGDTISLKGKGLSTSPAATIVFTGNNAVITSLEQESTPRHLRVIVPPGATDGVVKLVYNNVDIISPGIFKVYPVIKDISPRSGLAGSVIKITGHNFSTEAEENEVKFNGTTVPVTGVSETTLQVKLPSGISSGPVTVTVNGRIATGPSFTLAAEGTPVITELQPDHGPVNSIVVLKGENFSTTASQNEVRFAGNAVATVQSASAKELIVRVPQGAVSGPVTVTKEGKTGTSPDYTISSKPVPVVISLSPLSIKRGAILTINGANFKTVKEDVNIGFSGVGTFNYTPLSASENQLTVQVPNDISPGNWTIYVEQDGESSNKDKTVKVEGQPVIASLDPTQGIPGSVVTLTGTDFDLIESNNQVKFGNTVATLVNAGDVLPDKVSVYVPDLAPGTYSITLTAFGTTSAGVSFQVKPKPAVVRNVYYISADDIVTSQALLIKKAIFDPPSTQTVYKSVNAPIIGSMLVDLAGSKVYLEENGAIIRSNLNNTGKVELYDLNEAGGTYIGDLSLDAANQKLYWSGAGSPNIYSGNTDGSGTPELLYDGTDGLEIALGVTYVPEDGKLYIADQNYTNGHRILRANADGSGTPQVLFDGADGLGLVHDVKIDVAAGKIFIEDIEESAWAYRILSGNLDGSGTLTVLKVLGWPQVTGISLDPQEKYIYWMQVNEADPQFGSIYRAQYNFAPIPGTDPASAVQTVYSNIKLAGVTGFVGGIAVENTSGAAQRASIRLPLKLRATKHK